MDIKEKTLQKALRTLEVLGVQYKVVCPDGTEYGELEVVRPKKVRGRVFAETGYLEKLQTLEIGEVLTLAPPEGIPAREMQPAVCGAASRNWGAGTYTTTVNQNAVEILRLV